MSIRFSKSREKANRNPAELQTLFPGQSNYAYMGLHEELFKLREELVGLKHIITELVNQNTELKMERMNE
jgi:hypothetical protein